MKATEPDCVNTTYGVQSRSMTLNAGQAAEYARILRTWGNPAALSKRLGVSLALVIAGRAGDPKALAALMDGSASLTRTRWIPAPCIFKKLSDDRKKRPRRMKPETFAAIWSMFDRKEEPSESSAI